MKRERTEYFYKYSKENLRHVGFVLNRKTELDMIEFLEKKPNKQGFIKGLIRAEIRKQN